MVGALRIDLIGGLRVLRDGVAVALPPSRRARALLAWLILHERPQHREHLCELFWDIPDDPRGALRSALSKLRPLVNDVGRQRLVADREAVRFVADDVEVDLLHYRTLVDSDDAEARRLACEVLDQPLLAGLDLPNQGSWQAWLTAMRDEAAALRARLMPEVAVAAPLPLPTDPLLSRQRIGFTLARDGVRIAHASVGEGPPLVKVANWLNHLELDWDSPIWAPLFRELARDHRFIRYDERGNGMSDWQVADLSFDAFVRDLEAVVAANRLTRFPLLGLSQGVAVAIDYAARHPDKVSHLILWGGYAAGWRHEDNAELHAERGAMITLVRHGWGRTDPSYRQIFSQAFMPGATHEEIDWFNDFQRRTTSAENAARFMDVFADIDVRHQLARVRCPTLVMHARGDRRVPLEQGGRIAAQIPGAELVILPTDNHLLLGREPVSAAFVAHVRAFLAQG
ncbi:alpha/beta fold hydrolase [Sandaracinobacteroides saxicola]|uniref:Alpha/beta fold hydrolase n=1 Tax=Sandaracinobacteroides saxicola TaxID=2759707 RepID=A0A7G5IHC3_9SPHN|nr:alpha/beta fold hydrolase [Sandaracinobacteroides saxicola]QMW22765.1 alpha/beta fold hydrolase [Sandaracinobacteroides saxicola]